MPDPESPKAGNRGDVRAVSEALRDLHRVLLLSAAGPATSPNELFQRALNDPDLGWLRPLSRLIVDLDEAADQDEFTEEDARRARAHAERVLADDAFRSRYAVLGQEDPEAVMGLAEVRLNLRALPPG